MKCFFPAAYRKIIPDENCCYIPENLMMEVLSEVHYLPDSWRGQAHTTMVRDEFSQLFQYKAVSNWEKIRIFSRRHAVNQFLIVAICCIFFSCWIVDVLDLRTDIADCRSAHILLSFTAESFGNNRFLSEFHGICGRCRWRMFVLADGYEETRKCSVASARPS